MGINTSAMREIAPSTLMKEATLGFKIRMVTVLKSKRHAEREIAELGSRARRDFPKLVPRVAALGDALPVPPSPNAIDRCDGERHLGRSLRRFWRAGGNATQRRPSEKEAADGGQRGDFVTWPCRWRSDIDVGQRLSGKLAPARVDVRELRTEEEERRRGIHPHEDDHERACRAVGGRHATLAQVETDEELAGRKQQRGDGGAQPHVAPGDLGIGKDLE